MKRVCALLLFAICFCVKSPAAFAAGTAGFCPQLSKTEGRAGEIVELSIPYDGSLGELSAFLIQVDFDPQNFTYLRTKESAAMQNIYSLTEADETAVRSVCSMKGETPLQAGDSFTYRFQVSGDAAFGEHSFSVTVSQILSAADEKLPALVERLTYTILPPLSEEAALASLVPSVGNLQPEFSPDCFSYAVTVPFSTTGMTFSAEPVEGAVCKINRKNLGAGGSDTLFLITVTAEDGKTRSEYQITVHRDEKEASPKPTAEPKPEKSSEPSAVTAQRTSPKTTSTPTPKPDAASGKPAAEPQKSASQKSQIGGAQPSITIRNNSTPLPAFLIALTFAFACVVLRPLSRWLAIEKKPKGEGKAEDEENETE